MVTGLSSLTWLLQMVYNDDDDDDFDVLVQDCKHNLCTANVRKNQISLFCVFSSACFLRQKQAYPLFIFLVVFFWTLVFWVPISYFCWCDFWVEPISNICGDAYWRKQFFGAAHLHVVGIDLGQAHFVDLWYSISTKPWFFECPFLRVSTLFRKKQVLLVPIFGCWVYILGRPCFFMCFYVFV